MTRLVRCSLLMVFFGAAAGCGDELGHDHTLISLVWVDEGYGYSASWSKAWPDSKEWFATLTIHSTEETGPALRWVASVEEAADIEDMAPSAFAPFVSQSCGASLGVGGAPEYACNLFSQYRVQSGGPTGWWFVGFEDVMPDTPLHDALEIVREPIRDIARFGTPDDGRSRALWESGAWPPPPGT